MRNKLSITGYLLALALVFSCSIEVPNNNLKTVSLQENTKAYEVDLGNKNGGKVEVLVNIPTKNKDFKTKAINNGFLGVGLDFIILKLHNENLVNKPIDRWSSNVAATVKITSIAAIQNIKFSGLKPNNEYSLSGRAYSSFVNPTIGNTDQLIISGITGSDYTITNNSGSPLTQWYTGNYRNNLVIGDRVKVNMLGTDRVFEVTVAPTVNNVFTGKLVETSGTTLAVNDTSTGAFTVYKNVTAKGNYGDSTSSEGGMANSTGNDFTSSQGGGTAPGLRDDDNLSEEYISVSNLGEVTINNDMTLYSDRVTGDVGGPPGPDSKWAIAIQLVRDIGSEIDGKVTVLDGLDGTVGNIGIYNEKFPDFRVNTIIDEFRADPAIAISDNFNSIAVWKEDIASGVPTDFDIRGQRFDGKGSPIGSPFTINDYTTNIQSKPRLATDSSGNFVVTWDGEGTGDNEGIFARRFDAVGTPLGSGDILVNSTNTSNTQANSKIVVNPSTGDFIVVWQSYEEEGVGQDNGIYGRKFNSSGAPTGDSFLINTFTNFSQVNADIALVNSGDFVVVWQSDQQDSAGLGIFGQRFNATGPVGIEFPVNKTTPSNQENPVVAMNVNDNSFVVVWQGNQNGNYDIFGQMFKVNGSIVSPYGPEFMVNNYILGDQKRPQIVMDNDGNFTIFWESDGEDGDLEGIYAKQYNAKGKPIGNTFLVNTIKTGSQKEVKASMTKNNSGEELAVIWESPGTGLYDLHLKRFSKLRKSP